MVDSRWIGARTKPVVIRIDAAHVARFASAVCETEAVAVVPFTYPITFWNHCDFPWLSNISGDLFLGEQDIQYRRVLAVGETVNCQVLLENIVTKQGSHGDMQILDHVMEVKDEHEEPMVTLTSTLIILPASMSKQDPTGPTSPAGPVRESPKPSATSAKSSYKKGVFLGGFSESRIDLYANSSGDLNPIHMDEEYAKQSGFPARIVHGMLVMGAAAHHLQVCAEEGWSLTGLRMRFGKPAYAGDRLSIQTGECEGPQSFEVICNNDVCCTGRAEYTRNGK